MAYVYGHYRTDTGKLFYVGISTDDEIHGRFSRAYSKTRNRYWQDIVSKTEYTVKILRKDISLSEARKTEMKIVEKFGSIEIGGQLANQNNCNERRSQVAFRVSERNAKKIIEYFYDLVCDMDKKLNDEYYKGIYQDAENILKIV